MPILISKTHSELRIIGTTLLVVILFLTAVAAVMNISRTQLHGALLEINKAELSELARQIALTLDASLDASALHDRIKMQQIVDRNMALRGAHTSDNLLLEIRIHAPDSTSSVGYRAIAGSAPTLIGMESDPEDIQAIRQGELVVLFEDKQGVPILDITCPLHLNGIPFATAGIKMSMRQGFELIDKISSAAVTSMEMTANIVMALVGSMGFATAIALLRNNVTRRKLLKNLQEEAATDELTGLINRRRFMELAESELKRAVRFHHPLAIALLDIDRFKHINDVYGHAAGDKALIAVAKTLREEIRETDVAARLGGDEFILILPETTAAGAYDVLERCRLIVAAQEIHIKDKSISLTVSVGVASLKSKQETLNALMERADRALYEAKHGGRNQVSNGID
ncbi:MAG TPA: GGDEF domain-containing protein [Spongiibacteraceae bacterium]|nr:GGDEF domain-containing protein [Spongiibacteraceae bacterium]